MNYRTTLILAACLVAVSVIFYYARNQSENPPPAPVAHTLMDLKAPDVTRVTIEPAGGKKIVLERDPGLGGGWHFTSPMAARADSSQVGNIVSDIVTAKASSEVPIDQSTIAGFGLDKPQYHVKVEAGDKIVSMMFGNTQSVGSGVYVQLEGATKADVVDRNLLDDVGKTFESLRDKKLVDVASSSEINRVTITHPNGSLVTLEKSGSNWKITEPSTMPADDSAVTELLSKLSDLQATDYVEDPTLVDPKLNRPQLTVSFNIAPPVLATQVSTSASTTPAGHEETVVFGQYDDVRKQNVFVTISGDSSPAKISVATMDALNKQALDLRDKKMLAIDPAEVSTIQITTETPATTNPAGTLMTTVGMHRRHESLTMGPPAPANLAPPTTVPAPTTMMSGARPTTDIASTAPSTQMAATTAPSTEPVVIQQPSTWQFDGPNGGDAEDASVTTLLAELNPLKADRFVDKLPATRPSKQFTLKLTTIGPGGSPVTDYSISIMDPNGTDPPVASYKDMIAQVPRSLVTALAAKFEREHPTVSVSIPGGSTTQGAPALQALPTTPAP